MTPAEHVSRERLKAGVLEQIARDVATLKMEPPEGLHPSREFYEARLWDYRQFYCDLVDEGGT